jgi:hypothetical protein
VCKSTFQFHSTLLVSLLLFVSFRTYSYSLFVPYYYLPYHQPHTCTYDLRMQCSRSSVVYVYITIHLLLHTLLAYFNWVPNRTVQKRCRILANRPAFLSMPLPCEAARSTKQVGEINRIYIQTETTDVASINRIHKRYLDQINYSDSDRELATPAVHGHLQVRRPCRQRRSRRWHRLYDSTTRQRWPSAYTRL